MEAAIYARVSTERQDLQQTIESPIAILTAWIRQQGYHLAEEHHYCDRLWHALDAEAARTSLVVSANC
jgi:DNA invertase Pin-like site-specific DNA recombinase